jgi:hypothetical protein
MITTRSYISFIYVYMCVCIYYYYQYHYYYLFIQYSFEAGPWPGTHDPPAPSLQVLGLQVCTTIPSFDGLIPS